MARRTADHASPVAPPPVNSVPARDLDDKTRALVRLAALIARGASGISYRWSTDACVLAGATVEEVVGTLIAVAPTVGLAHVVSATPALALAVGYDIDASLEQLDLAVDWWSPAPVSEDGS